MYAVITRALTKTYGGRRAVDALGMHVAGGDIYGFVGKNGAGKSTTMKLICGLARPTAGEVELFAPDAAAVAGTTGTPGAPSAPAPGMPSRQGTAGAPLPAPGTFSHVGALIESPGILPSLDAFDNLMAKALALGVVRPREHCRDLLELVGLADAGHLRAKKFSLGMKQRLGLALALVASPDLLLLDEPFNGMDPEATRTMRQALVQLNRERGVTIVISSHVLDQLDRMATRFGVIRAGHMVREFTCEELHAMCGSAVRVKTTEPARTLAVLEERLPASTLRAEPDGAVLISAPGAAQRAQAAPAVEEIARILHDAGHVVTELTVIERDIEDYFVELMGAADEVDGPDGPAPTSTPAAPRTRARDRRAQRKERR